MRRYFIIAICLVVVLLRVRWLVPFVDASGELPAFEPRFTIDTLSYLRNAKELIDNGEWFYDPDTYHSVGMPLYLSACFRLFGESLLYVKQINILLWAGILFFWTGITYRISGSKNAAVLVLCFLALSNLLAEYCATLQYEIPLAFLMSAVVFIQTFWPSKWWPDLVTGVLAGVITLFHFHYVGAICFVLAMSAAQLINKKTSGHLLSYSKEVDSAIRFVLGAAAVLLPFVLYYAERKGGFDFLFDTYRTEADIYLNPNAPGYNFPVAQLGEPHGFRFIIECPDLYLRYLGRKLLYLIGAWPDIWHIESVWTIAVTAVTGIKLELGRIVISSFFLFAFLLGVTSRCWKLWRGANLQIAELWIVAYMLTIFLPQLFSGSSTRYLVPVLPMIIYVAVSTLFNWRGSMKREEGVS